MGLFDRFFVGNRDTHGSRTGFSPISARAVEPAVARTVRGDVTVEYKGKVEKVVPGTLLPVGSVVRTGPDSSLVWATGSEHVSIGPRVEQKIDYDVRSPGLRDQETGAGALGIRARPATPSRDPRSLATFISDAIAPPAQKVPID